MCRDIGSERLSEPFGVGRGISLVFVRAVEFFLSSFLLTSSMVVAGFSNLLFNSYFALKNYSHN